jgi:hypothetical protein
MGMIERNVPDPCGPTFELPTFLALSGSDLLEYAVTILDDADVPVTDGDLLHMAEHLCEYDWEHTLFALEIGCSRRPGVFLGKAPGLLAHWKQSVRLAANRVLEDAPPRLVTEQLLRDTEQALRDCPERKHFASTLCLLRKLTKRKR